jgi:predicted transglutaminase-like cysteine proteinase
MRALCVGLLVGLVTLSDVAAARAQESEIGRLDASQSNSRFLPDFGPVAPPHAFNRFCIEMPDECTAHPASKHFGHTALRLEQLDQVNRQVNNTIRPETDIAHYGIEDYWTIPKDGKGDCEDYALLKRHILVSMGWPSGALLMTVVLTENNEGHAVLMAHTESGDLILDNRATEIKPWYQTRYQFKMRQSTYDPKVWLDLDPADDAMPAPISQLELLFGLRQQPSDGR